ncbi:MAG: F0F1 ATP synthase subunit delta [Chloroflexi bacterium]|nr:F0F1 ATP synthase subunit delta [Chloroflexota bacterium]
MLRDPAAKRYAQAAFALARERNELDVWERQLATLGEAAGQRDVLAFLASFQVSREAKQAFLQRVLEQPAALVWNLVRLLASKGRLTLLPQIAEHFAALLDEQRGIAHAEVVTAVALSDADKQALARRLSDLTGKQVQVEVQEAPEILGGVIARIGDRLIDGSTRNKLLALKRRLAGGHSA